MTRRLFVVGLIAASVGLLLTGSGEAKRQGGANALRIPERVQRLIEARYPSLAYGPVWLPSDYHFANYTPERKVFFVAFSSPAGADALTWGVAKVVKAACGPPANRPMRRFKLNGTIVSWGGTEADQEAWRCIQRHGTRIKLIAAGSGSGDDSKLDTPKSRHDALVLAKAVAYAAVLP
jgi:hypothetical protein